MRCPGKQKHSKEAVITQIIKGTKLLRNNTLVHTYFEKLFSDANERPQRNQWHVRQKWGSSSLTLMGFISLLSPALATQLQRC